MNSVLEMALSGSRRRSDALVVRAGSLAPAPTALPGLGRSNTGGLRETTNSSWHASEQVKHFTGWVHSAIRPIATRVAGQPIRVARVLKSPRSSKSKNAFRLKANLPNSLKHFEGDFGAEMVPNHPLIEAVNDPNSVMVRWALLYVTVVSMQITGRAFWWVKKKKTRVMGESEWEVWPLPSEWVQPVHTEAKIYSSWEVTLPGESVPEKVPFDEIVYFYYPDFRNPLGCDSPTQAQARAIVADENIQEAQRKGFQSINPSWLLTVGRHPDAQVSAGLRPVLTAEQRAQLIHAIKAHYRGVMRWDEPMILDGLIESATRNSFSNMEMGYAESGKATKERITQGYGVPPVIMGQLDGANRASSLVADETFLKNTVNPLLELISECMTAWLGPLFARRGERILVYIEPAITTDRELELKQVMAVYDRCGVDINYLRHHLLGLPPVQGGNVCFVRPELVPIQIHADGEQITPPEQNPFIADWLDRPKISSSAGPTPDAKPVPTPNPGQNDPPEDKPGEE